MLPGSDVRVASRFPEHVVVDEVVPPIGLLIPPSLLVDAVLALTGWGAWEIAEVGVALGTEITVICTGTTMGVNTKGPADVSVGGARGAGT